MPKPAPKKSRPLPKLTRDLVLYLLGLGGAINQLFIVEKADPAALAFCGLLLGFPLIQLLDEKRKSS